MKRLLTFLTSVALLFTMVNEVNAKRFGGGGFGKSFSSTPYKKPAPKQQPQQKQGQADQQPGTAAAAGSTGTKGGMKGGMMGSMLGGLMAGGLFAYLLGSGAFEGLQIFDILLIVAAGLLLFMVFRGAAGKNTSQRQALAGDIGYDQQHQDYHPHAGSRASAHAVNLADNPDDERVPMNLPPGFNALAFIDEALDHYRLVQDAWNRGDMNLVGEYVSPDLLDALQEQRRALRVAPNTEILDLSVDIVRADSSSEIHQISLLFRGRCRDETEKSEDGIFDTWHLERNTNTADANWIIIGVEAE